MMRRASLALSIATLGVASFVGCDAMQSPASRRAENEAEAIRDSSQSQADSIRNNANNKADQLREANGKTLTGSAKDASVEKKADEIEKAGERAADQVEKRGEQRADQVKP